MAGSPKPSQEAHGTRAFWRDPRYVIFVVLIVAVLILAVVKRSELTSLGSELKLSLIHI